MDRVESMAVVPTAQTATETRARSTRLTLRCLRAPHPSLPSIPGTFLVRMASRQLCRQVAGQRHSRRGQRHTHIYTFRWHDRAGQERKLLGNSLDVKTYGPHTQRTRPQNGEHHSWAIMGRVRLQDVTSGP